MNREEFLKYAFRKTLLKGLAFFEESTLGQSLNKVLIEAEPENVRPPGAYPTEKGFLERCTGCDACMAACPANALLIKDLEKRDPYLEEGRCIQCPGYPCIAACPAGALTFRNP